MELSSLRRIAKELFEQHELDGWEFVFDGGKRRFGQCDYTLKEISMSRHLVELNIESECLMTLLHEIAHALAPYDGHGNVWAQKCRDLGIIPARCYDAPHRNVVKVQANFYLKCPNCGQEFPRFRRSKTVQACADCCTKFNGGTYSPDFRLFEVPIRI